MRRSRREGGNGLLHVAITTSAVLLFDEAEALFGKRSEVRDARDRYPNIDIAYLLQRIEEYDGWRSWPRTSASGGVSVEGEDLGARGVGNGKGPEPRRLESPGRHAEEGDKAEAVQSSQPSFSR